MDYIIGLDIGTSNTKAIAFDLTGGIVAEYRINNPMLTPEPSHCEQDPEWLVEATMDAIAQVSAMLGERHENARPLGVSFSSAMHGLIAMDRGGKPLTNCIIWADTRSEPFAAALRGTAVGHDIYMKTGTPIHPMSPLCKLGWMREHMGETFASAHKFISVKEYIFFKLFGEYVVDFSIASATGLFDIHSLQWYGTALETAGISAEQLSTPVPITHMLKGLDSSFAVRMGIPADTPFIVGGSDGCLANLGGQAILSGIASVTIGTSGAIRMVSQIPKTDPKERIFSYVLTPDLFVLGGAVNNGGNILKWFNDGFFATDTVANEGEGGSLYQLLTSEGDSVAAGAHGLIFLPYLTGERAPHWDAKAKGLFFGIQLHHQRAHFVRAMMEGIIFGIYGVGKALQETAGSIDVIYASGGFARSALWVQMLADVFNTPVFVKKTVESSAMGAAIVGMKALDIIDTYNLGPDFIPSTAEFIPDREKHTAYMANFAVFERLYEKVKDEF